MLKVDGWQGVGGSDADAVAVYVTVVGVVVDDGDISKLCC